MSNTLKINQIIDTISIDESDIDSLLKSKESLKIIENELLKLNLKEKELQNIKFNISNIDQYIELRILYLMDNDLQVEDSIQHFLGGLPEKWKKWKK